MANQGGFVFVYTANSHRTPAEEMAYNGPMQIRYRNGKFFKPDAVELSSIPGEKPVEAVYTNDPAVKAAYEKLRGTIHRGHPVNVVVHPIAPPVADSLPDEESLKALTRNQLSEEYGIELKHSNGRARKKADMIAEILES